MESPNFAVDYESDLITTATHLYSGTIITTDAPLDNHGKASAFSPTDLVSSALASCMISVIAINFKNRGLTLYPIKSLVKKVMAANPRRISEIHIEFDFGSNKFSSGEMATIERLMNACPVANSLDKAIRISITFKETN